MYTVQELFAERVIYSLLLLLAAGDNTYTALCSASAVMWLADGVSGIQLDALSSGALRPRQPAGAEDIDNAAAAEEGNSGSDGYDDYDSNGSSDEEYVDRDGDGDYGDDDVDIEAVVVAVPYINNQSIMRNKPVVAEVEATIYREDVHYNYECPPTTLQAENAFLPPTRARCLNFKYVCLVAKCLCNGTAVSHDERSLVSLQFDTIGVLCSMIQLVFSALLLVDGTPLWTVHIDLKIPSNKYDYNVFLRHGYCSAVNGGPTVCVDW